MINDFTFRVLTTWSRTRISTFVIDTCFIRFTIGIYHTFWFTIWWRSYIINHTGTHGLAIYISTNSVCPTWRWITYVGGRDISF